MLTSQAAMPLRSGDSAGLPRVVCLQAASVNTATACTSC